MTDLLNRIHFYVINLDRSADRMERFRKDFASFPIPFIRVPAIDGKELTPPISDYDASHFFTRIGRQAIPGEIGCFLSHVKALRTFLESDKEFALICEDDATPIPESYEAISQAIAHCESWDLLRLIGNGPKTSFPYRSLTPAHNLCTSIVGLCPAAAYIVNRRAAEILVRKLIPMTSQYDDALHHGRVGVREATVFPNCILRNEFSKSSTIEDGPKRNLKPWNLLYWTCRFYRLQVRIVRYSLQIFRILRR